MVKSSDLIAYEDLQIANLVKNHHLAKSISDAAWGQFLGWLRYYGGDCQCAGDRRLPTLHHAGLLWLWASGWKSR